MKNITLEELLEAGCHFGHQVTRQNPKAREFIFEARDGIHIIDLEKTKEGLDEAALYVHDVAKKGGTMLVLSTKRQAQEVLKAERKRMVDAKATGLFFVTQRWIGGTLTNFAEVAKNYKRLHDLTAKLKDEFEKAKYTKKEINDWDKLRQKLEGFYGGTKDMTALPNAIFIIDTHIEQVAVAEALAMGIPVIGITDTNSDPTVITYPIPANDDAVGSLKLIIGHIFDAWMEGLAKQNEKESEKESSSEKKEDEADAPKEKKVTSPKKTVKKETQSKK